MSSGPPRGRRKDSASKAWQRSSRDDGAAPAAGTTAPVARELVNFMGNRVNAVVLHQDRRVVATQLPKKSELRMGENLVQGDLPIVASRKKRQELKDAAARG